MVGLMVSQFEPKGWRPERENEVLPFGIGLVCNATPSETKPKEYGVGLPTKPERVWYIVYHEVSWAVETIAGREARTPKMRRCWEFSYTKREAIRIAQRLDGAGHMVTDVFRGTKTHISNKYEGLNYIRKGKSK